MRRVCAVLAMGALLWVGCGKYGPPVRTPPAPRAAPATAAPAAGAAATPGTAESPKPDEKKGEQSP